MSASSSSSSRSLTLESTSDDFETEVLPILTDLHELERIVGILTFEEYVRMFRDEGSSLHIPATRWKNGRQLASEGVVRHVQLKVDSGTLLVDAWVKSKQTAASWYKTTGKWDGTKVTDLR